VHTFDLNVLGTFTQCSWRNATPSLYFKPYGVISQYINPTFITILVQQ